MLVLLGKQILASAEVHNQSERQGHIHATSKDGAFCGTASSKTSTSSLIRLSTNAPRESRAVKATFTSLTLTRIGSSARQMQTARNKTKRVDRRTNPPPAKILIQGISRFIRGNA